ncbi:MAG: serine hydrolase [Lentimicrobiaceae bacterium]|nr:serine hydrolase [Lentimicrobiaceae bacterium]
MRKYLFLFAIVLSAFSLQAQDFSKARQHAENLLREELKNEDVRNAFLSVYSPSKNIDWNFVGGKFAEGKAVTLNNPFYSASIGKTFTAVAIAILKEQGKLMFSDKTYLYLPDSIIDGLHVLDGKEYSLEVTIAQLLQHTSGIPDYIDGETLDGTPNGMALLFSDTAKFWYPMEMIQLAKSKMKADFVPGTSYKYSNTDYVLLGLIIENVSGMPVHDFYRKYIFEPCDMNQTSMFLRSKSIEPTGKIAEIFAGNTEVSKYKSLSMGWTGGGLATTASDLNKFQLALHTHKIIKAETVRQMYEWVNESTGLYYGYGLRKVIYNERVPDFLNIQFVGHTGSTSSFMFYCPELDVYLAGTLNQVTETKKTFEIPAKIFSYIENEFEY